MDALPPTTLLNQILTDLLLFLLYPISVQGEL